MSTLDELFTDYVRALRSNERENAYHRLVELGADVIPLLMTRYNVEPDSSIRSTLVKIAWNTNSAHAIPLLSVGLHDGESAVWKEALDGLVSLGGQGALDVVRSARQQADKHKSRWLDEAIQQIADK